MNRNQNMIVQIGTATKTDKAQMLDMAINSQIEIDCLTEDMYVKEEVEDDFIELIGNKKVKFVGGKFPKRYIEDEKGAIESKDGKKYRKMTVEDCGKKNYKTVAVKEVEEIVKNIKTAK